MSGDASRNRLRRALVRGAVAVVSLVAVGAVALPSSAATKTKLGFRLKFDAPSITVARGSTSNITVLATRIGKFAGPIKLSSSTRKGLTITFDENPLAGDDTDLFIRADASAAVSRTTLTVTGKSGSLTVKVLLAVRITAAVPGAATTSAPVAQAKPVAASTAGSATTVPTNGAAPTTTTSVGSPSTATTVASPTTTQAAVTSTTQAAVTSTTRATTTTAPKFGDVIVTRKVTQILPCNDTVTAGALVSLTARNFGTLNEGISWMLPGTCSEVGRTDPFNSLSPGVTKTFQLPVGTVVVARESGTGKIRKLSRISAAPTLFAVEGPNSIGVSCSSGVGTPPPPASFTLQDGERYVMSDVPAGWICRLLFAQDALVLASDNVEPASDLVVVVPWRAGCPPATPATPTPGPLGCYAEFTELS